MKRGPRIVILVGALVVVAGFIAWPVSASAAARSVIVTTDARPLVCAPGQEVRRKYEGHYVELARLTPALDCTLRIHVYNDGGVPVTITRGTFDLLGVSSTAATVQFLDGAAVPKHGDGLNASGVLSGPTQPTRELAPGQGTTITAHITASKRTCVTAGGAAIFSESPIFTLTALGISETRRPTDVRFGFLGTSMSSSKTCSK